MYVRKTHYMGLTSDSWLFVVIRGHHVYTPAATVENPMRPGPSTPADKEIDLLMTQALRSTAVTLVAQTESENWRLLSEYLVENS